MESRKMVPSYLFLGQQWRNRYREQTHGLRERGGMGEMYGERIVETYITICKIDSQWEFSVSQETQTGALCQCRGMGRGCRWEGCSRGRKYMYTYG